MFNNEDTPLFYHFKKMAKHYYGHLCKELGEVDIDRYYAVLAQVCKHTSITQQALSNNMGIDKASMVRMIDYLHKHGYVTREVHPGDRRQYNIKPTIKAELLYPKLRQTFLFVNNECMSGFTATEKQKFYSMMERIIGNLANSTKPIPASLKNISSKNNT